MIVRPAQPEDTLPIVMVWQAAFAEKCKPDHILRKIKDKEFIFAVAEHNGTVIGFADVKTSLNPAKFNLYTIAAHPIDAPHGTGQALLKWVEQMSHMAGATCLNLAVRAFNKRGIMFYEKAGYTAYEVRPAGSSYRKELP